MTEADHKKRHEELHRSLDELFADYIYHHPDEYSFLNMPFEKLLKWAFEQTKNPTPTENEK
jgi:hypothetical protein